MQQWSHTHAYRVHLKFKIPEYGRNTSRKNATVFIVQCCFFFFFYSTARRHFIIRCRFLLVVARCCCCCCWMFLLLVRSFHALKQNWQFKAILVSSFKRAHTHTHFCGLWFHIENDTYSGIKPKLCQISSFHTRLLCWSFDSEVNEI